MIRRLALVCISGIAISCADRATPVGDTSVVDAGDSSSRGSREPARVDDSPYLFVSEYGVGDLRAGMTLEEAQRVVRDITLIAATDSTECSYLNWPTAPAGVLVMFEGGRLARFDVDSAGLRTAAGAQVGDSEARVDSLYAGRIVTTPHKYTDGHYLTVTPIRAADSLYRTVFEAENGKITRFRVGTLPQVQYVEGCS